MTITRGRLPSLETRPAGNPGRPYLRAPRIDERGRPVNAAEKCLTCGGVLPLPVTVRRDVPRAIAASHVGAGGNSAGVVPAACAAWRRCGAPAGRGYGCPLRHAGGPCRRRGGLDIDRNRFTGVDVTSEGQGSHRGLFVRCKGKQWVVCGGPAPVADETHKRDGAQVVLYRHYARCALAATVRARRFELRVSLRLHGSSCFFGRV
jgi:hypothetical protein